jgi:hypothetical protein
MIAITTKSSISVKALVRGRDSRVGLVCSSNMKWQFLSKNLSNNNAPRTPQKLHTDLIFAHLRDGYQPPFEKAIPQVNQGGT